jgi:hypothetical protein
VPVLVDVPLTGVTVVVPVIEVLVTVTVLVLRVEDDASTLWTLLR